MSTDSTRYADALGIYLSGGSSNSDPDSSLGGAPSTTQVRGMGSILASPIPGVRVDNTLPAVGEGSGTLAVDTNGDLVFTPPGGTAGTPVPISAGDTKLVTGEDTDKGVIVFRESGLDFSGSMFPNFVFPINGVLGQANVSDSERSAGKVSYRGVFLKAHGPVDVKNIRLWLPPIPGHQALWSIATETPGSGDSIQTIASETTAPTGLTWVRPETQGDALTISLLESGSYMGLWIRRDFPSSGKVSVKEDFNLTMMFLGS